MLKSGFFNSVDGDRKYSAEDLSSFFIKLISNGVFPNPSTCFKVIAKSGLTVTVQAGFAFINAKYVQNTADYDLTLDAADTTNPRIDKIVLRFNATDREITLNILKGTPAAEPEVPALTRNATIYELGLANIAVSANATAIVTADISDRRGYSSDCGYVTGLIQQIDTDDLFDQFEAAFYSWFNALQTNLTYNARVTRLTYNTTTTASTSTVHFVITDFNPSIDIVNVYVNGFKCTPNAEYTVNNTTEAIEFTNMLDSGAAVLVEILRSIGEPAPIVYDLVGRGTFGDIT